MATHNSDVYAKQIAPTALNMADPLVVAGNLAYYEATVTITSGMASGDIFNIVQVPANMRLIPELSSISSDAAGTGVTVDVGDDDDTVLADADRYAQQTAGQADEYRPKHARFSKAARSRTQ